MNFQLLVCLGMGLFTTFMGLTMITWHFRDKPKVHRPPAPNFRAVEGEVIDPETGAKFIYQEITVSTRLERPEAKGGEAVTEVKEEVKEVGELGKDEGR